MQKIAIIGLGYVGLPLAKFFLSKYTVIGFDIDQARISELNLVEETLVSVDRLFNIKKETQNGLFLTSKLNDLKGCNIFIITVPTPVDKSNNPDLSSLLKASETIGYVIKKDDIVIYESTVYPGATEEACIPVIEKFSGLKFNKDFYAGYSPERVSPGDKAYTIEKITSGSNHGGQTYPSIGLTVSVPLNFNRGDKLRQYELDEQAISDEQECASLLQELKSRHRHFYLLKKKLLDMENDLEYLKALLNAEDKKSKSQQEFTPVVYIELCKKFYLKQNSILEKQKELCEEFILFHLKAGVISWENESMENPLSLLPSTTEKNDVNEISTYLWGHFFFKRQQIVNYWRLS